MAIMNFQATKPNSAIWKISVEVLLSNGLCLMNKAIFCKEHIIFFALPAKKSLMSNREIGVKLLSHSCELAS